MKELTKREKGYLNQLFSERLKKLKEIEEATKMSLALSMDNYREKIDLEREIIKGIKEAIYNY